MLQLCTHWPLSCHWTSLNRALLHPPDTAFHIFININEVSSQSPFQARDPASSAFPHKECVIYLEQCDCGASNSGGGVDQVYL